MRRGNIVVAYVAIKALIKTAGTETTHRGKETQKVDIFAGKKKAQKKP